MLTQLQEFLSCQDFRRILKPIGVQSRELKESKANRSALAMLFLHTSKCMHVKCVHSLHTFSKRGTDGGGEDMMAKRKRLQGKSAKSCTLPEDGDENK